MNISIISTRVRRSAMMATALLASGLLASCAGFLGPRQIEVPLHKLQAGLDRRFPIDDRMLELFDVHLSRPQLILQPERDRVAVSMSAEITPPFVSRSYSGMIEFSGHPYVDTARGGVFVADPRVDRFVLDGVDGPVQRQLTKLANFMMDKMLRDVPVYTFRMEDLRYGGVQFVPTGIRITSAALIVKIEPAK
jgi:hypothetical protein